MNGDGRAPRAGLVRWAAGVAAVTIVLAIGAPLVGRGLLVGADVVRTVPPWSAETPSSFVYRHGGINDTIDAGAPARAALRDALVDGAHLRLWDPYPNGGAPLGSIPNSGLFAPTAWPELLLGVGTGAAWAALLRLAVAALGTFFLLRRLGVGRFAGVCGGLVYATSGFVLAWTNWPQADVAALMPVAFLAADVARARRRIVDVLFVAAVVAALLLTGYLPLVLVALVALALFLLVRWWDETPRAEARDVLRAAGLLLGGVVLGAALVAFLLVPFVSGLGAYDLSYRSHNASGVIPPMALLTTAFPWAQGSPAHPGTLAVLNPEVRRFTVNFVEQFAFLGAAAVVMALWAVLRGRPPRVGRGVYRYSVLGAGFCSILVFGSGPGPLPDLRAVLTDVLYAVPGVEQIPVARFVAPMLFLASLVAGFGIELVAGPPLPRLRWDRRFAIRTAAVVLALAYVVWEPLRQELTLLVDRTSTDHWGDTVVHVASQRGWILRNAAIPMLIGLAAIVVVVVARRWSGRARTVALVTLPVLLAVEGLLVTGSMLPRVDRSEWYPETGLTRYLESHLGHERVAPGGTRTLYYATNSMYGIRSVGGHSLNTRGWHALIKATRPEYQRMLQNRLGRTVRVATSPILDRLAARYFVAPPDAIPFGTRVEAPPATGAVTVGAGRAATAVVPGGPRRAVEVRLLAPSRWRGDLVFLDVTVRDPSGRVLARGSRRLRDRPAPRSVFVPVAGEELPFAPPLTVTVALRSDARDAARLAATGTGTVSLGLVRPAADGLRVTYAGADGVAYRRLHALSRFRWASRAEVVSPRAAVRRLARGVPSDTVLLARPGPAATGAPATVRVERDGPDDLRVRVDARGAGYLVVADAIQSGWRARLDGHPVRLRAADRALVAIRVPAGVHILAFAPAPDGWGTGLVVTLVALGVVLLLVGLAVARRRRARRRPAAHPPDAPDPVAAPAPMHAPT